MTTTDHETLIRAQRLVLSARAAEDAMAERLCAFDRDILAVHLAYLLAHCAPPLRESLWRSLEQCQEDKEPIIRQRLVEVLYAPPADGD